MKNILFSLSGQGQTDNEPLTKVNEVGYGSP
jgi:hypothetical protein